MTTKNLSQTAAGNQNAQRQKPRSENDTRKQRSDGIEARERLLLIALKLFAEKGFAKTSTREIALAAEVNIASISYYFGDKAGLYRAVFTEPIGKPTDDIALFDQPHFTLRQTFEGFFAGFVEPMRQGDLMQLCTRLHFREMLEPTGLWTDEIENRIKPSHLALVGVLNRHLGVTKTDDDVHRLAFSITGLALQMFICGDVIGAIRPKLIGTPAAIDQWAARLVDFAEAMVAVEITRRSGNGNGSNINLLKKKKS
ncbi:MAG: CerR family C-terminal domain-containing protein [Herminiimonas sp.]|nr:CerR family C-terminal domain-containing protein [Herminiimonas sp.]